MGGWMSEWMGEWLNEWANEWKNEWVKERTNKSPTCPVSINHSLFNTTPTILTFLSGMNKWRSDQIRYGAEYGCLGRLSCQSKFLVHANFHFGDKHQFWFWYRTVVWGSCVSWSVPFYRVSQHDYEFSIRLGSMDEVRNQEVRLPSCSVTVGTAPS